MSVQDTDISLLIEGCKRNERKAQEALYRHFYPFAAAIALRYVKNNDDMADVVSQAFIKLFKALPTFDTKRGTFHAWQRTEPTNKPDSVINQDRKPPDRQKPVRKNIRPVGARQVVDSTAASRPVKEKTDSLLKTQPAVITPPVIKVPPPGTMDPPVQIKPKKYGVEVSDSDYRFKTKPKD